MSTPLTRSPAILLGILRAGDVIVVIATALLANQLRNHNVLFQSQDYLSATVLAVLLTLQVFHFSGAYSVRLMDAPLAQIGRVVQAWAAVWLAMIAVGFFTKTSTDFSRIWAGLWFWFSLMGFVALRLALKIQLVRWRRAGLLTRRIAVVGAGDLAGRLIDHLKRAQRAGIEVIGIYDDRTTRLPSHIEGVPVLGTVDDLIARSRDQRVDQIIVALPWSAEERLARVMERLRTIPVDIRLCPDRIGFQLYDRRISHLAGLPMFNLFDRPLSDWSYVMKAMEDRVLAGIIAVLVSPLMLAIAIAIKLDSPGPVLFRQQRYGFNNNVFTVFKFRTMRHGGGDDPSVRQARRADPRVTRVGALLRQTSLDELPQLFNVLNGDMSLVGPRPHAVAHNEAFAQHVSQYFGRHRVKPGITGWAQVHGLRGEIDNPEKIRMRVQYDLYYIDNWSLLLDLNILARTLFVGLVHENAY
ncbi:MAG TPA: undecaprenyl-phosphate glucose phosphotransferase [Candidatus Cybelea sp.]|nr:undecaprenyl-phosphate glucose phosphotransferase [Candidatus Cybelea sp.]